MSTFNTERLKQLTSYAIKGAGFNQHLELSALLGIRVDDGTLYLNTTDGINYLSVSDSCSADSMDITVDAELFAKLISKITSETLDMSVVDNTKLEIKGNGKYTLELVPDETGALLSFPDKFPEETTELCTIPANDLVVISTTLKPSLNSIAGSIYSEYYFGGVIASTDRYMMGVFNKSFFDTPRMFNKEFVDLMVMCGADVVLSTSNDVVVADARINETCSVSICTKVNDTAKDFNIQGITKFVDFEAKSFCRIRKAEILNLLDRLSLFVSKFDDGTIQLHFTSNYVEVSSMASSGVERVDYTESKDASDITIKINIDRFKSQLKSYNSDIVDLYYGNDVSIKLVDGAITQVIALVK